MTVTLKILPKVKIFETTIKKNLPKCALILCIGRNLLLVAVALYEHSASRWELCLFILILSSSARILAHLVRTI